MGYLKKSKEKGDRTMVDFQIFIWIWRAVFILCTVGSYIIHRELEKVRKEIALFDQAPDFIKDEKWWGGQKQRIELEKLTRNIRDAIIGFAMLFLLLSFWFA